MQKRKLVELILQYENLELNNVGSMDFNDKIARWFRNLYCKRSKYPHFVVSIEGFTINDIVQREGRLLMVAQKPNMAQGIYISIRSMYSRFSFHLILHLYFYYELHYYEQALWWNGSI